MIVDLLRIVSVLVAAIMLGSWFQKELRKAWIRGLPWYKPYLSPPGLMIVLLIVFLPILARLLQ